MHNSKTFDALMAALTPETMAADQVQAARARGVWEAIRHAVDEARQPAHQPEDEKRDEAARTDEVGALGSPCPQWQLYMLARLPERDAGQRLREALAQLECVAGRLRYELGRVEAVIRDLKDA
jgi:hypothetical protein